MKIRSFIAIAALVVAGTAAHAQQQPDWSGKTYQYYNKYPGYVVTLKGDTVKGFVEHGDRTQNQDKAIFYTDPNDKKSKTVYKPEDIKAYGVGDKNYRSIQWSGGLMPKPYKFNLLIADGHIAQYRFYTKDEGYGIQVRKPGETDAQYDERICKEQIVWQKGDEKPIDHQSFALKFSKKMAELVSDNAELAKKVENKEKGYGMMQMYDIIKEYNDWYKENHK